LDAGKKEQVIALVAVGCGRRIAARYVGCSTRTIRRAALRDAAFAARLRQAQHHAEVHYLQQIRKAAQKEQYWRAAAWVLEHTIPERYARRNPAVITVDQIAALLAHFARIVVEEIPVPQFRQRALKRLTRLAEHLAGRGGWRQEQPDSATPPFGEKPKPP
jgi:hypothetical protein